jgi:tetratricopeptide (TPR) repeat protein
MDLLGDLLNQAESFMMLPHSTPTLLYSISLAKNLISSLSETIFYEKDLLLVYREEKIQLALDILYLVKVESTYSENYSELADSTISISRILKLYGKITECISELESILEVLADSPELLAELFNEIGNACSFNRFNPGKAIVFYEKAKAIRQKDEFSEHCLEIADKETRLLQGIHKRKILATGESVKQVKKNNL